MAALLSFVRTFLKSENLLHKRGFVDSQMKTIVKKGKVTKIVREYFKSRTFFPWELAVKS